MNALQLAYRATCRVLSSMRHMYFNTVARTRLYLMGVKFGKLESRGLPVLSISKCMAGFTIGDGFVMNNGRYGNPSGESGPCVFLVAPDKKITIGDNVGISQSGIIAADDVTIGNYVKIGAGCLIYTSDYHSLDYAIRRTPEDQLHRKTAPVVIEDDVFIGARCIITKGVTIGARSVVGIGSVVTKSIPPDEIWAGVPARFIKKLTYDEK